MKCYVWHCGEVAIVLVVYKSPDRKAPIEFPCCQKHADMFPNRFQGGFFERKKMEA